MQDATVPRHGRERELLSGVRGAGPSAALAPLSSAPARRREMSSAPSPLGAPLPWDPLASSPQSQPPEPAEPEPETVGWVARFSRPCAVCREGIPVGQSIFPAGDSGVCVCVCVCVCRTSRSPIDFLYTTTDQRRVALPGEWAHLRCLSAAELVPPICKYFVRLGRCARG